GILPPWSGVQRVVTLYDLLIMRSQDTQIAPRGFQHKKRQLYKAVAAGADAIITISATTKQDIVHLLGVPETQVYVTHLGIDQHFWQHVPEAMEQVLQSYELVPGYLLFVGAISGRKNTARLVQAYARSRASKARPLVLVG